MPETEANLDSRAQAAFRLKMLNRPGIISRSGLPSSRNLDKRYRPPRIITDPKTGEDKLHPLDAQRGGPSYSLRGDTLTIRTLTERPRDTTGSFGEVSSFQGSRVDHSKRPIDMSRNPNLDRAGRIAVTAGLPGRSSRGKARKRGGDQTPVIVHKIYNSQVQSQLYNLRNDILTLDVIGSYAGRDLVGSSARSALVKINSWLMANSTTDFITKMGRRDVVAKATITGELKVNHITAERIKSLGQRLNRALISLRVPESTYKPTVAPVIFKPNCVGLG